MGAINLRETPLKKTFKDYSQFLKVYRFVKVVVATGQLSFSGSPVNALGLVV